MPGNFTLLLRLQLLHNVRLLNTPFYSQDWDTDDFNEIAWASVILSEPPTVIQMDVDYDVDYDTILQHLLISNT